MSNPHANHQGEPSDTGTGGSGRVTLLPSALWQALDAEAEIWARETDLASWLAQLSSDPRSREKLGAVTRLCFEEGFYRGAMAAIEKRSLADSINEAASAPTPPDRVGEEVGRADYPEVDPKLEAAARALAAFKIASADPTGAKLPEDVWHQAVPEALAVLASAPSPEAGAGGDLASAIAAEIMGLGWALPEFSGDEDEEAEEHTRRHGQVQRAVEAALSRSGKLVASTGSGEETRAYLNATGEEFSPLTGAPASPSGRSRAEPFGLGPEDECPSRDPSAPGVLWSAWSETDADSDPSDPGVSYCTEWFVGRWPIGAEEPDCRILIGTSRSAEIIARRVAEKLTSILNTDRIRLGSSGWRTDCFRTRMSEFDAAYKKAGESSQPQDWMDAALLAQQFRNVAYAVLIGEAPRQEPPISVGWVLVPREPDDAMVQAGGSMLPPTHRLNDCYDYFREAWAAALDARPIPPGALAGEAEGRDRQGSVHEHAAPQGATPETLVTPVPQTQEAGDGNDR